MNTKLLCHKIHDIRVVIHLSQYTLVTCLIGINLNFFEIFSGYDVTNSNVSIYHIRYSIVSTVRNVLCTSGGAMGKNIFQLSQNFSCKLLPQSFNLYF